MQPATHDFKERLAWSQAQSDEPFWDAVYRKAFPNLVATVYQSHDGPAQRSGIDRHVVLSNGSVLRIDEKKRERDYGDILLEYLSNSTTGAPGWIEKDLLIDYLAYAFMPTRTVYLFPWLMLRRAWLHYKPEWTDRCKTIEARNPGYVTRSLAVPITVLQRAVQTAAVIRLEGYTP